jgi:hypothetical protein
MVRNDLWTTWLRRRSTDALATTVAAMCAAVGDPAARAGLGAALLGLPWALRERVAVDVAIESDLKLLLTQGSGRRQRR